MKYNQEEDQISARAPRKGTHFSGPAPICHRQTWVRNLSHKMPVAAFWVNAHLDWYLIVIWTGHPSLSVRTSKQSKCQSKADIDWSSQKFWYRHLGSGLQFGTEVLDPVKGSSSIKESMLAAGINLLLLSEEEFLF